MDSPVSSRSRCFTQGPTMPSAKTVLDLIGRTPMLRVNNFDTGPCELFLKLESQNPGGSIKDRIGLCMIRAAEESSQLGARCSAPVEATAGNTGLGLALVASQRKYRLTLVIPGKMSQEKVLHLKALGAEVILTRSDVGKGHPAYYQDLAQAYAAQEDAFYVNQFGNPANPLAHEQSDGPLRSSSNLAGTWMPWSVVLARVARSRDYLVTLRARRPTAQWYWPTPPARSSPTTFVLARCERPACGSSKASGKTSSRPSAICRACARRTRFSDGESLDTARRLLQAEGVLAGSSSGTLLAAALRYCREQTVPKRVVTLVCDSGSKYLSKAFNDAWMADEGLLARPLTGDLRDLVTRRFADRAVVSVAPDDTLIVAYARMRLHDVSQLPVIDEGRIVGIVDDSDLLLAASAEEARLAAPVREVMSVRLTTVAPETSLRELLPSSMPGSSPS